MDSLLEQVRAAWVKRQQPGDQRWTLDRLVAEAGLKGEGGEPLSKSQMLRKLNGESHLRTFEAEALARALGITLRYDGRKASAA